MLRLACFTIVIVSHLSLAAADEPLRFRGTCMGTAYAVTVAGFVDEPTSQAIAERVGDELERIEQVFSLYRPSSELSRFNAAETGAWIGVSDDLLAVTQHGLELARQTGGAFDPTVAPLIRLWRIPAAGSEWSPPTKKAIAEIRKHVDFRQVQTRDRLPAIRKLAAGIELDLNALVEGYAIDRVIDLLLQSGVKNALVELGGEFGAIGHKTNGQAWQIGIENPLEPNALYATVSLRGGALATSGNYRQAIEHRGRRYGHILDARLGEPVTHDLVAVSVIAKDAITADGWATALMTLGPSEGFAIAEEKRLAASFFMRAGAKTQIKRTKAALSAIALDTDSNSFK